MIDSKKIEFLCFEGGGGKGLAYLGAIRALEELEILPSATEAPFPPPLARKIRGVTGASAGAMTAFLVALGYNYAMLLKFFDKPEVASDLLQDVDIGRFVKITYRKGSEFVRGPNAFALPGTGMNTQAAVAIGIQSFSGSFGDWIIRKLNIDQHLVKASVRDKFLEGVLVDAAFLVGGGLRKVLFRGLATFLKATAAGHRIHGKVEVIPNRAGYAIPFDVSFEVFKRMTGVSLAIPTTNISKRCSVLFSDMTTPEFPVIEAVAMSASHPFLFKPTIVDDMIVAGVGFKYDVYNGLHVDGGAAQSAYSCIR